MCGGIRLLHAACVINAATPHVITCTLGANVTWAAGDVVEVTLPATAGANATANATNTALVVDDMGRTSNNSFPVTIVTEPGVSDAPAAHLFELRILYKNYTSNFYRCCMLGLLRLLRCRFSADLLLIL
jgi:hypothetical protein